jgi:hypothetical protein
MYSNLGILLWQQREKAKNLASFSVLKLCGHLPFLPNLDRSFIINKISTKNYRVTKHIRKMEAKEGETLATAILGKYEPCFNH